MSDTPEKPTQTPDFKRRWAAFVSWMDSVRSSWPVEDYTYRAGVHHHFFNLLNHPNITDKVLTPAHAIRVLEDNGVPAKDAGFIMFVLFVSGAVWGNRGVLPMTRDEDTSLGAGTEFNPEDLQ